MVLQSAQATIFDDRIWNKIKNGQAVSAVSHQRSQVRTLIKTEVVLSMVTAALFHDDSKVLENRRWNNIKVVLKVCTDQGGSKHSDDIVF